MTLLTMIKAAQDTLSLPRSNIVTASTDDNVRMLLALANQEGRQLARSFPWQDLQKEKTFTSVATAAQDNAIPSDFDRLINGSMFNRTQKRRVTGPLSATEWQAQQTLSASVLTDAFRIRADTILITPTPPAGDTYAYEYVSNSWCQDNGGNGQAAWAADTDTGILDENLMLLGLIWRFRKARGFDYAEEMATYEMEKAQAQMRDGGKRTLYYGARPEFGPGPYVPGSSWNL